MRCDGPEGEVAVGRQQLLGVLLALVLGFGVTFVARRAKVRRQES